MKESSFSLMGGGQRIVLDSPDKGELSRAHFFSHQTMRLALGPLMQLRAKHGSAVHSHPH